MRLPRLPKRRARSGPSETGEAERRSSADARRSEVDQLSSAAADLSISLGGVAPQEARLAAVERLTEMRAEGRVSEEDFIRERRRLMGEG
jgi:hypothetical protein